MAQEVLLNVPPGKRIRCVCGTEPHREGEYPTQMARGFPLPNDTSEPRTKRAKVAAVELREQNLGTYGILWYVAFDERGIEMMRMNALHVAEVYYEEAKYGATVG